MIRLKNGTENLFFSITKNCETLIKQTLRKPEGTLEYKLTKPRQTFHSTPPISIEGYLMIGLFTLEVYNSVSDETEEINKFEHYAGIYDEFRFLRLWN